MRKPLLVAIALLTVGATEPEGDGRDAYMPGYTEPASKWTSLELAKAEAGAANCRDRIEQVRDASGQPRLDRETASPEEPLLIAAVDHRIDGCAVMVMRKDVSDVRPLPEPSDDGRVMPAQ